MTIQEVHHGTDANIGLVGLTRVEEMARVSSPEDQQKKITKTKQALTPAEKILCTVCGLMCPEKTNFDQLLSFYKKCGPCYGGECSNRCSRRQWFRSSRAYSRAPW